MSDKEEIVFCKGGGCTAKLGPGILARVLEKIPKTRDENLMIGYDSSDDAAVYKLTDDLAVVQTLDFFPPMVDDPYTFGQKIAAANALSDIYDHGRRCQNRIEYCLLSGKLGFEHTGADYAGWRRKSQRGGRCSGRRTFDRGYRRQIRTFCNGNHTPGQGVCKQWMPGGGCSDPDKTTWSWNRVYCKPDPGASEEAMAQAIRSMTTLNKYASEVVRKYQVHGCTDVTGFGFLGHLLEMLGDAYSARVESSQVPYIPEAFDYAGEFYLDCSSPEKQKPCGRRRAVF